MKRQKRNGFIDLEYSELLSDVSIDDFHFKVTWSPLHKEACILWFMDSRATDSFEALGQFSNYDQRKVLEFIARYVTSGSLRQEIDNLRFERKVDNLSPAFFKQIERMSSRDKELAFRSLFKLDDVIEKSNLIRRRSIMAKRFHPDVGGDHKSMTLINEAYEFLLSQVDE